jgi:hypothetical protein
MGTDPFCMLRSFLHAFCIGSHERKKGVSARTGSERKNGAWPLSRESVDAKGLIFFCDLLEIAEQNQRPWRRVIAKSAAASCPKRPLSERGLSLLFPSVPFVSFKGVYPSKGSVPFVSFLSLLSPFVSEIVEAKALTPLPRTAAKAFAVRQHGTKRQVGQPVKSIGVVDFPL